MSFRFDVLKGRFTVAEWLTHSPATLEVTGSQLHTPPSAVFLRFISLVDTVSGTDELEMICVALQEYCDL